MCRAERDRVEVARKEEAAAWAGKLASLQTSSEEQISALRQTHAAEIAAMAQKEQSLKTNDLQRLEAVRKESAQEMAAYKRRADAELATERERLREERALGLQELEAELARREAASLQHLEKTRDEEMEMIISKLDAEYAASRLGTEEQCEKRVRAVEDACRLRQEQLEVQHSEEERKATVREARLHEELKDSAQIQASLEREVKQLQEKLGHVESELAAREGQLEAAKTEASQGAQASAVRFGEQVGSLQQRLRDESQKLEEAQAQLGSVQDKLAGERVAHKEELATLRSRKASELEEVSLRVRQTVAKKDAIIQGLKRQLAEAEAVLAGL